MWSPFANGWCEVWFERRLHFLSINYAILGVWTIGLSFFFVGKFWEKSREAPQLTPSQQPTEPQFQGLPETSQRWGQERACWVILSQLPEFQGVTTPLLFFGGGHLCFLWFMGCGWVSAGQLEHLFFFFSKKSRPLAFRTIATWANFITTSQTKPAGWSPPKMAIMSLIHSSLGISSEFAPKMDGLLFSNWFLI